MIIKVYLCLAECPALSASIPLSMRLSGLSWVTGVRQLNPKKPHFSHETPVSTRVEDRVFQNACGGTYCETGAFIDLP
jgi:hypothetical protein